MVPVAVLLLPRHVRAAVLLLPAGAAVTVLLLYRYSLQPRAVGAMRAASGPSGPPCVATAVPHAAAAGVRAGGVPGSVPV